MSKLFQEAEANWAEDEAYSLICSYNRRRENEWTAIELKEGLTKDVAHMHKIFARESDGNELIARFDAFIEKNLVK